ncbi:hypothetical protein AB6A40_000423 [Gnathostoma spinigerum]|uniref:Cyclic nucleotide-binding domain-containing protein n=1 Tax=Gnathostoma spinigerum TaxID=75299 RepID=A0ABD6E8N2_9BILA
MASSCNYPPINKDDFHGENLSSTPLRRSMNVARGGHKVESLDPCRIRPKQRLHETKRRSSRPSDAISGRRKVNTTGNDENLPTTDDVTSSVELENSTIGHLAERSSSPRRPSQNPSPTSPIPKISLSQPTATEDSPPTPKPTKETPPTPTSPLFSSPTLLTPPPLQMPPTPPPLRSRTPPMPPSSPPPPPTTTMTTTIVRPPPPSTTTTTIPPPPPQPPPPAPLPPPPPTTTTTTPTTTSIQLTASNILTAPSSDKSNANTANGSACVQHDTKDSDSNRQKPSKQPEKHDQQSNSPADRAQSSESQQTTDQRSIFSRLFHSCCRNKVHDAQSTVTTDSTDIREKEIPPSNDQTNSAFKGGKIAYFRTQWVIDTKDESYYYWLGIVSCAYAYNLTMVIARSVFNQLEADIYGLLWLIVDICMDLIYLFDMFVASRTGFLEQGLLVRDIPRIRKLYLKSTQFKIDMISLLPLDLILGLAMQQQMTVLRLNRMIRYGRLSAFIERTETRSSRPNVFRVFCVVINIIVIIHWNACFYFCISEKIGLGADGWVYGELNKQSLPDGVEDTLGRRYIYSFYWSTLILTTIGEVPGPVQNIEFIFVTLDLMCGVLIFASIVGNVGSMISSMSAARTEFQTKMDGIKRYMELRKVSKQLERRVIKWFDYLWANKQSLCDQQVLKVLPDKLQAEIAMHVHFETLRKVRIFQDCEAGLLAELVLKLQLQVFSPNDYICRKGDIGREMYIVKRGKLQVVADDGVKVFVTLQEGAVFGELSILNIAGSKNGNRRTANVRSVGYTDLFVLNKNDLWSALKEYPDARKLLIAKGREILRKDNLLDENAPEEQMSAEELAENLQNELKLVQTRMARFVGEFTNTKSKLLKRIAFLEGELQRYESQACDSPN